MSFSGSHPPSHPVSKLSTTKSTQILRVHTASQEKVISIGLTPFCSKHSKLVFLQPHKTRQSKPTSRLPYAPYPRTPLATVLTFCSSGLLPLGFISTHPLRPLGPHLSHFRSHQSDISAIDSLQVPLLCFPLVGLGKFAASNVIGI